MAQRDCNASRRGFLRPGELRSVAVGYSEECEKGNEISTEPKFLENREQVAFELILLNPWLKEVEQVEKH